MSAGLGGALRRRRSRAWVARPTAGRPMARQADGPAGRWPRPRRAGRVQARMTPRPPTPASPRARSLWRHPDFMKLWSAETVSQFGTQVSLLAIPLVAITILRATPFQIGLLGTIE